jgi:hypothetical protein
VRITLDIVVSHQFVQLITLDFFNKKVIITMLIECEIESVSSKNLRVDCSPSGAKRGSIFTIESAGHLPNRRHKLKDGDGVEVGWCHMEIWEYE